MEATSEVVTLTDYMNSVSILVTRDAYQKVVWLDVTIDQRFVVDRLYTGDLYGGKNGSAPEN